MTLYENIQVLEPFFHSIRKHQSFFIIDVKIPEGWSFKENLVPVQETIGFKDNGVKGGFRYLSFFSKQEDKEIELSKKTILDIIKVNQEREEKERLLQEKIIELKRQFEVTDLDSLKGLHFDFSEPTVTNESLEIEDSNEGTRLAEQGAE
jgi:hypothetical protein